MKEVIGSSVVLLGYGREGRSAHRYLLANHPDIKIGIADQQQVEQPVQEPSVELHIGENYLNSLVQYDVVVRSPGIPATLPALQRYRESGGRVTSATNIFFSECPGTIIGITGTKGKSTTSSLIARVLEENYPDVRLVGNIGRPALDYLPGAKEDTLFVAELSSHQLEDVRYSPHIAVVLAISPEHLDYYQDFSTYVNAKKNIIRYQRSDDIVIFNPSHKTTARLVRRGRAEQLRFSLERKQDVNCYTNEGNIFVHRNGKEPGFVMTTSEIPLLGEGNIENTLAAISVGLILDIPLSKICHAVREFKPLPHRLEFVGERQGIRFYNDSLATIPEAAIHALNALGKDVETLIAGGHDRGLDFSKLGQVIGEKEIKTLILFPPTGEKIWRAVCNAILQEDLRPKKYDVSSMEEAVKIAFDHTPLGKICLLSPASASFGLFANYEDRGNAFKNLVLT